MKRKEGKNYDQIFGWAVNPMVLGGGGGGEAGTGTNVTSYHRYH